jgi:hypothetical protein
LYLSILEEDGEPIMKEIHAASIIFAAGYGSRMKDFTGNKTLLPLMPASNIFE